MLINLKPHGERRETAKQVIDRLRDSTRSVGGIALYLQPVQELTIEDRVSRTQFQFTLTCPDEKLLEEWTPRLVSRLQDLPQLSDVASDLQAEGLQAYVEIDRDDDDDEDDDNDVNDDSDDVDPPAVGRDEDATGAFEGAGAYDEDVVVIIVLLAASALQCRH